MSNKLTLYYSGDGTEHPRWFETEKLAQWHQDRLFDGWPCTGSITVEGDNLSCSETLGKEGYYLALLLDSSDDGEDTEELDRFRFAFFPDGLPIFTAKIIETNHYGIFVNDRLVYRYFAYPEEKTNAKGLKRLEGKLSEQSKKTRKKRIPK